MAPCTCMLPSSMKMLMVIPTLNEEAIIEKNVGLILAAMKQFEDWHVVIADNGSTDRTREIVRRLTIDEPRLLLWTSEQKGKGLAVRGAWTDYQADIYAFMDADLSTDLEALPHLLAALDSADIVVGDRFHPQSTCARSLKRELVSRAYVFLRRLFLKLPVKDTQCGCKAMKKTAWEKIKKDLTHTGWFFDTELLAFATKCGLSIVAVPIQWAEAPHGKRKSKMHLWRSYKESFSFLRILKQRL